MNAASLCPRKRKMEKMKSRDDLEITELGEIFFFYRPKVDVEHPHSADEVQRLYMVLRPVSSEKNEEVKQDPHSEKVKEKPNETEEKIEGEKEAEEIKGTVKVQGVKEEDDSKSGKQEQANKKSRVKDPEVEEKNLTELRDAIKHEQEGDQGVQVVNLAKHPLLRLIIVGRKVLPDPSTKSRTSWCFVDLVTTDVEAMKNALSATEYDTKTRGHRVQPGARPAGEGVYCVLRHKLKQQHTHLVYKLDFPKDDGQGPQDALHIEKEASFIISIKNPQTSAPPNAGLGNKRKASFPAKLQGLMGSYRFLPAHPPDFLNYEGCEFILAPASDNIEKELGMELEPEEYDKKLCGDLGKMVDLGSDVVRKPLFDGEWA